MKDYKLEKKFHEFRDLRDLLKTSAEKYADKVAFVTKIKNKETKEVNYINTTYAKLFDAMGHLGTALIDCGYKDKRIAVIGENSYNWCLAYFAASCGVGVTVPLDKALQKEEIVSCLNRSKAEAIFYDKKSAKMIEEIFAEKSTALSMIVAMDFASETGVLLMDLLDKGQALVELLRYEWTSDFPVSGHEELFLRRTEICQCKHEGVRCFCHYECAAAS